MKKQLYFLLHGVLFSSFAWSQTVYDGYAAYHQTRNGVFDGVASFEIPGGTRKIVTLLGKRFALDRARAFPGEHNEVDLGHAADAYRKSPFACVEGQSSSASGTAVRYQSVYLFDMRQKNKAMVYKLSSLFGACLGVRLDAQLRPLFDHAKYVYEEGSDLPVGLRLHEYVIANGKFEATGHAVTTRFVEPGNVYKFEVLNAK